MWRAWVKRDKRLTRLLKIILLVQARPDWRPGMLAKHFRVSQTRIHQDIRELVGAGVPICFSGEGYKIAGEFVLSSTSLNPDEVLELLYPQHLFSGDALSGDGSVDPARSLLEAKLASCVPAPLRARFANSRIRVLSATAKGPRFRRLHDAVAERRRIRIKYASRASGRTTDREIDPYALIFRRHAWYLIGWCHRRTEVRKFRVSRIRSVIYTQLHFPEPRDFSLDEYARGWWEVFGGEPANVAVRFKRRVADLIRDRAPRPGQTIQELPGGDIIYRAHVSGIDEIGWWIMQYGPDAEVLEPAALRKRIRSNAVKMVALYSTARRRPVSKVAEAIEPYYPERS
jgi:predicted DNA-binding transcriptional regulator YafY